MRSGRDEKPLPVMYVHLGDAWIRGSERILLDLLSNIDRGKVLPTLVCNQEILADAARSLGVPVAVAPMRTYLTSGGMKVDPMQLLRQVTFARTVLAEHSGTRPSIIHSNGAAPCQWLAPYARTVGIPLVAHLHTAYLKRSRYALMTHLASRVIGVSAQAIEGYEADGMPAGRLGIVENGISPDRINGPLPDGHATLRARLGIAGNLPIVLAVGSLIRRKGHDRLVAALASHGTGYCHLVIIGEGEERAALLAQAAALGVGDRVHLMGDIDAAHHYRDATIFALASRSEAFGLVLAEAGITGLACIASDTGGIAKVVENAVTGILTTNADDGAAVDAIAQAMARLLGDANLRQAMGQAARERVSRLFTSQRMAGRFHEIYDELDAGRGDDGWFAFATTLPTMYRNRRMCRERPSPSPQA